MIYLESDIDKSYYYYKKAYELSNITGDINNIGISSHNLANVFCIKGDYRQALFFAQNAIKNYENLNSKAIPSKETGLSIVYRYIGNIYHKNKLYDSAAFYYNKAILLGKSLKKNILIIEPLIDLGKMYNELNQYEKALPLLNYALDIMNYYTKLKHKSNCYLELSISYQGLNNIGKSYYYYKLYKQESDSISRYNIKEMETKLLLQKEKEKSTIQLADSKYNTKILIITIVSLVVSSIFIILFILYKYHIKKKHTKQLTELNRVKTKLFSIISHDLKSPIESILQSMILNKGDTNIIISLTNIKHLIDNLLNWSRIQMNGLKVLLYENQLESIISESVDICKYFAMSKNISIKYFIDKNLVLFCDRHAIGLCIRNVLINAIKL